MTSVAFCPLFDAVNPLALGIQLRRQPIVVSAPSEASRWVTHVAAQLSHTADPLLLVFSGQTAIHAPAIGFSRRALRRPAIGYVLVDPAMPTIGGDYGDWPDAPVTVVLSDTPPDFAREASLQARLRGWTVTQDSLQDVLREHAG
ncbi:MAG: hypothetical protein WCO64_02515 [Actinomycetes bacterium]